MSKKRSKELKQKKTQKKTQNFLPLITVILLIGLIVFLFITERNSKKVDQAQTAQIVKTEENLRQMKDRNSNSFHYLKNEIGKLGVEIGKLEKRIEEDHNLAKENGRRLSKVEKNCYTHGRKINDVAEWLFVSVAKKVSSADSCQIIRDFDDYVISGNQKLWNKVADALTH